MHIDIREHFNDLERKYYNTYVQVTVIWNFEVRNSVERLMTSVIGEEEVVEDGLNILTCNSLKN